MHTKTTLKEMVENILRNLPETRNSDIKLTVEIWRRYYPQRIHSNSSGESFLLKDLFDLPREDNVKRERARLNAEGKYFPTDWEIAKNRGIEEDKWRVSLGYTIKAMTKDPSKRDSYMDQEVAFSQPKLI